MKNKKLTAQTQLDMLVDFGRQLSSETHFDKLLALTAKQISKIIGARHCFIFIKDEKHGEWCSKIARGKGLKYTEVHLPAEGDSIAALVARTGETVNIIDAYNDPRFAKGLDLITGFKTETVLAVPLLNKEGRVIGVFQLNNKENGAAFDKNDEGLLRLLSNLASGNIEIAALYEDVKLSNTEIIYRLAITSEFRDQNDTKIHLRNIAGNSYRIARAMGLGEQAAEVIKDASLLHDIGKVAIPDYILLKPGKLSEEEYELMKAHTFYGGKILQGSKSKVLRTAHKMSLYHHERWDGSGYPAGLKGEAIPLEARIVAAADVFDALCMRRVYKNSWKISEAYKYMLERSGKDFDPKVIEAFKAAFNQIKMSYIGAEPRRQ
ncbi:MAG: HD domain-containing protein [Elusimicrobiota bacterium]|jgi:HD-GYP domain-containing protein (c-di-GMP phosphodiesterase class II)|nr:HD domain-containing protein [Elusimicrobiota bacterium]